MPDLNIPIENILNVDFEINNFDPNTLFRITDVTLSQAENPCTRIRVNVTTSELAPIIGYGTFGSGGTIPLSNDNTYNPFHFDVLRGLKIYVKCQLGDETAVSQQPIKIPGNLYPPDIIINNSPEGATVVVEVLSSTGLNLQYSLDSTTWQTSNVFSGLEAGNYTLYVRDQFGCLKSNTFSVDEYGIQSPYFYISKSNSIRFAQRVNWGVCNNYKTDENTLSCEADVKLPYKEIQQFQSCDKITTQFKSNYDNISAVIVEQNGSENPLLIEPKTNNMRLNDMRDARIYNLGSGKTGIYFLSGNIYDYATGSDTGQNYVLNGALPEWAVVDNHIRVLGAWFIIEDIIYDENRNAEVIIIDNTYFGNDNITRVASVFNRFNYEVFEFTVNMSNYTDQNIRVRINNDDNSFESLVHLSELINVKEGQKNTVEIIYKNNTNTDIFYATGIEHKIRLPLLRKDAKPNIKLENHETDTNTVQIMAEKREGKEFVFEPVTEGIMNKLTQALIHKFVFIDRIGYVCNSNPNVDGALGNSNLYVVKAVMIKSNMVYNSNGSIIDAIGLPPESLDVPSLIEGDGINGFIEG